MKMEGEATTLKRTLAEWKFSQYPKYILLPIDENNEQISSNVKNVVFSEATPIPLENNVRLVCVSVDALANILDMDPDVSNREEFVEFVSGRKLPYGALPIAHRYGGHQYGLWAGQLGDGRAHIIGEYVNSRNERWQLQLKGSGPTPYSRMRDGRLVLRAAIREMVVSEACHYLGVPTTRAAAVIVSDEAVVRDMYYSGCPRRESAAVVLRLAKCWFRFGSLEVLSRAGELTVLRQLTDFIIKEHFPDIHLSDENRFIRLFSDIAHRTLDMVAKWQGLGFTHGLLNTDNMSILGITMDYGPFGFVDSYDSGFVANCSDGEGKYALAKQPDVVVWNIGQLANALKPLLTSSQQVHMLHILKTLDTYCKNKILETFLMKIGLKEERWGDEQLVEKLLDMMQQTGADFTATFRQLAELEPSELVSEVKISEKWSLKRLSSHASWGCWLDQYRERLDKEAVDASSVGMFEDERRRRMLSVNPIYVPRNWILHEAIVDAEKDDFGKVQFLLEVIRRPYDINPEAELRGFSAQPPQWAYALKISCST
ncbi:protein adenylyltransferase SelO isoform X1 [Bombyx mori]|uniref:Selenoprotein O n=1 Tax=Bombyx mori TaxID=7091 RepID=A0A8R2AJ71_BOMMO|nr:protein adenylyltransferase SelO isoform X1 [Bombyx mori]